MHGGGFKPKTPGDMYDQYANSVSRSPNINDKANRYFYSKGSLKFNIQSNFLN